MDIYDQPVTADQIQSVQYTIQTPSIQHQTVATESYTLPVASIKFKSLEDIPSQGTMYLQDSVGVEEFQYAGVSGSTLTGITGGTTGARVSESATATFVTTTTEPGVVLDTGEASLLWTETTAIGPYIATCQFSLITGEKRSVITSFNVIDPFNPPEPTAMDMLVEAVWIRLEDCIDSTEGGPWLRDRTLNNFDKDKIAQLVPEALFDINVQMPPTNYTIDMFTSPLGGPGGEMNPMMPLLIKGTLILVIRHLMRSYTEIYTPTGQGQLVWADRTRYQQAWGQIYEIEYQDYIAAVRLAKRTEFQFGRSALLTLSRAGRLYPYTNYATRGIFRGFQ